MATAAAERKQMKELTDRWEAGVQELRKARILADQ